MPQDAVVLPIGKKTVEFFQHRSCEILTEEYREAASVSIGDCYSIAKLVADGFLDKTYQNVVLVYTNFVSLLAQTPAALPLLPLTISSEKRTDAQRAMIYEGGSEAVFNAIVPEYLGGVLYGALCESTASEQAARRMAMDAASKNADEIIENLNLQYNRARQGAITQEITEIVAGAESSRLRKLSLAAKTDHSGTRGVPPHLIQKECESFVNQKHRHRRPGHRTGARHPLPGGEPAESAERDHA